MSRVGVLALQGGYAAHVTALTDLGHDARPVRYAAELETCDGLVLPGGESTTHLKIIDREGLWQPLDAFVRSGRPVLATCAGVILAARAVHDPEQRSFEWLDLTVHRNAWGRQLYSFEAVADDTDLPLLFIRAPRLSELGPGVEVLARFRGEPVLVRQGAFTGAAFHPELTPDRRVHQQVFGAA